MRSYRFIEKDKNKGVITNYSIWLDYEEDKPPGFEDKVFNKSYKTTMEGVNRIKRWVRLKFNKEAELYFEDIEPSFTYYSWFNYHVIVPVNNGILKATLGLKKPGKTDFTAIVREHNITEETIPEYRFRLFRTKKEEVVHVELLEHETPSFFPDDESDVDNRFWPKGIKKDLYELNTKILCNLPDTVDYKAYLCEWFIEKYDVSAKKALKMYKRKKEVGLT